MGITLGYYLRLLFNEFLAHVDFFYVIAYIGMNVIKSYSEPVFQFIRYTHGIGIQLVGYLWTESARISYNSDLMYCVREIMLYVIVSILTYKVNIYYHITFKPSVFKPMSEICVKYFHVKKNLRYNWGRINHCVKYLTVLKYKLFI